MQILGLLFILTTALVIAGASATTITTKTHPPRPQNNNNALVIERLLSSTTTFRKAAVNNEDDFYIINNLLADLTLALPDTSINKDLPTPLSSIDITLTDLECSDVYLHDLAMSHDDKVDEEQQVDLSLSLEVDLTCNFNWVYSYDAGFLGSISDDGQGQIYTENNEMATTISFTSPDFETTGPTSSTVDECAPVVNVVDMAFRGSVSAAIANVFEFAVRNVVEKEISETLCEELGALGDVISTVLLDIKQIVDPYLNEENQAPNDPLSAERLYANGNLEQGVMLFDFMREGSLVNFGIDAGLKEVDKRLTQVVNDGNGQQDLGVNALVRSFLLDDDGYLTIPLNMAPVFQGEDIFVFEETSIAIKSLRIKGLDTFTDIEVLEIIGSQTLQNRLSMKYLELEVEVDVNMQASDDAVQVAPKGPDSENPSMSETLIVKAAVRNLDATVALFVAIDQDKIGELQLGSLFYISRIPDCFLGALHDAEFTQLHMTVGDIDPPTIESLSSKGLTRVTSAAFEAITEMYEELFLEALPAILDDTIRPILNDMAREYLGDSSKSGCPLPPDKTDNPVIDMRDLLLEPDDAAAAGGLGTSPYGDLVSMLKSLVNDLLLTPNNEGILPLNDLLVGPLTKQQSGVKGALTMPGDIFNEAVEVNIADLNGMMQLGIFDFSVTNVDSISNPIEFLESEDAYILNNRATFGGPPKNLRLSLGLLLALGGDKQMMRNEMIISFELTSAELLAAILMKMDKRSLMQFPVRDTLNPYCWLATMPAPQLGPYGVRDKSEQDVTVALNELKAVVQQMKIDVQCVSCTSPGLQQWSDILSSPEAIEDATGVTNMLLNYATGLLDGDFVQVQLDRLLNVAASKCPSNPSYGTEVPEFKAFESEEFVDDSSGNFFLAIGVVAAILAIVLSFLTLVVRFVVRRRHQRWLKSLSSDEVGWLLEEQLYEKEQEDIINRSSRSMFQSKSIPLLVRLSIPVVIVGNICLFLSGHLSLGGTIKIAFQLGQQDLSLDRFYDFSIAQTVIEMWNAGATAMAMLIAIFSGLWPYSKQLTTLVLWFMPPAWVSSNRRGKILAWLDALGKYSFVDIFVLIVAMVAFRVSISSPSMAFLPENLYSVDLILVALWGLYANMTAQILSQLNSHVIIHYHDKVVRDASATQEEAERSEEATPSDIEQPEPDGESSQSSDSDSSSERIDCTSNSANDKEESEEISCLCNRTFGVGDHNPEKSVTVRSGVNHAIVFAAVSVVILMIIGCVIPAFHFEILGIVGVVVESGQQFDRAIAYYSVFSIVENLIGQAIFLQIPAQFIGLGTLSVILIVTTLVMPLVLVGMYLRLWFGRMTKQRMERTLFRIEIIKSWQYSEVFILSVIIAAWQVGGLSGYMVNEYCGPLDGTFATLTQFNLLETEDGQCFYVRSKVESGTYLLMAGAFLLAILSHFVCKAAAQKLHEDKVAARRDSMSKRGRGYHAATDVSHVHPVPVHFTDTYKWFLTKTAAGSRSVAGSTLETTRTLCDLGEYDTNESSAEELCSERSQNIACDAYEKDDTAAGTVLICKF